MNSTNEPSKQSKNSGQERYAVESGVPVPSKRVVRPSKYPFARMQPNQSTLITGKSYGTIMGTLRRYKAEGKKFLVRQTDTGFRVWRLE